MKRKTTPAERREYINKQRSAKNSMLVPPQKRVYPIDMSFIDREGNIVRPSRKDYEAKIRAREYNTQNEAVKLNRRYDQLVSKYGKDSEKVYNFEREQLGMHRQGKNSRLEILGIIGIISGLFFLIPDLLINIQMSPGASGADSGWILGAFLLVFGLAAVFLGIRKI